MVTNDDGRIAVKYLSPNAARVDDLPYLWQPRRGISLAWVDPEDWEALKDRIIGCCGDGNRKLFYLATQREVEMWLEG